jgi:hypothetical protein
MPTTIPEVKQGQYLIIRVNGDEYTVANKPTLAAIYKRITCECVDTITLDQKRQIVMMVDDEAAVREPLKPVNHKATALYHARCRPGTTWPIRGDVAIVNDEDFA